MVKNKKILFGVLAFLPVSFWVFIILRNSVNIPWFDDFDPFPDFLRSWINNTTFADRLQLLFQPNNEHRMVIGKLVTLLYFWTTGHLNFTFLHIAGACFTLGTLFLFWQSFKRSKINWWYFLPVPFLLFQLQYHLIFLWAICSLQHQPVIFFVSLSMFLLARNRFGWAILAGICATFAMSNGIFVWVSGAVILLLRSNYRVLVVWLLAGTCAIGIYFYGLSAQGNESSIDFFLKNPHLSFLGFFAFLGGLFDFFPEKSVFTRSVLPVIAGFLVMIWVAIWLLSLMLPWLKRTLRLKFSVPLFVERFSSKNNEVNLLNEFLLGILTFLLVNALIIGLLRPRFGFFVMIVSNYKIYPALFLSIAYLSFISSTVGQQVQKKGFQVALVISVTVWGLSIYGYLPTITDRRKYLIVSAYNQEHNGYGLGHIPFSVGAKYVDKLMGEMVNKGIYTYPEESNNLAAEISKINDQSKSELRVIGTITEGKILVSDPDSKVDFDPQKAMFAFVRNKSKLYIFKLIQHKYSGRNFFRQYDKGVDVEIPLTSLEAGTYELGFLKIDENQTSGRVLKSITVP